MRLAWFVSSHGFGHATRASAVMQALRHLDPQASCDVFTEVPPWIFREALPPGGRVVRVQTDVGLVQRSAFEMDLAATVAALKRFLPLEGRRVEALAEDLARGGYAGVLCDISPLGIAVARAAGLPSVLVDNFTWDWIYEPLLARAPGLAPLADELRGWFRRATWRLRTAPVCAPDEPAAGVVAPVARRPLRSRDGVRADLGVSREEALVLVTAGGIPQTLDFLPHLRRLEGITFAVTGTEATRAEGNLRLFQAGTPLYLPDLVRGADAVVAKLGYSTLAEVWQEGRPLAWVPRAGFREGEVMRAFAEAELPGFAIAEEAFQEGGWIELLPGLVRTPGRPPRSGGAGDVARFVLERLGGGAEPGCRGGEPLTI